MFGTFLYYLYTRVTYFPCIVSPGELSINATPSNVARFFDNVTVMCSSRGGPDNVYQWLRNGIKNTTIGSQPELIFPLITAYNGGKYTCIVSNAAGITNVSFTLYIQPYIETDRPMQIQIANVSELVTFSCVAFGFPTPVYQWNKVDDREIVYREQNLTFSNVTFDDVGMYQCVATITVNAVNYSVNSTMGQLICKFDTRTYT